jgi:hypothetical protein
MYFRNWEDSIKNPSTYVNESEKHNYPKLFHHRLHESMSELNLSGDNVGNPPIICTLSGYGKHIFDNVPVVIKSFSVDFKDSVNYIRCTVDGKVTWVPILSTITVTVSPIYNRTTVRQFNLKEYALGAMVNNGLGYI